MFSLHTVTVSDFIEKGSTVETEIVRVISLSRTEITEITRLKKKKTINDIPDTFKLFQ